MEPTLLKKDISGTSFVYKPQKLKRQSAKLPKANPKTTDLKQKDYPSGSDN